jgi:class 3 adenylate cyclase
MTDEGYVGLDVHRATRSGSAGHGGQILLSEATRRRIEPCLASDAALHRLGEFILKGLPGLESISQLRRRYVASAILMLAGARLGLWKRPWPSNSYWTTERY